MSGPEIAPPTPISMIPSSPFQNKTTADTDDDCESVDVCLSLSESSKVDDEDDIEASGGTNFTNSGGDSSSADQAHKKEKDLLAKEETDQITRLRYLVIKVLLLAGIAVSIVVYTVASNAQEDEYKKQYDAATKLVEDAFENIMVSKMGAVSSMGVALIAHGIDQHREWPFVTLSSFAQRASTALSQSGAIYLHVNPLVTEADQDEWESEFVVSDEANWIDAGIAYQEYVGLFEYENATGTGHLDHPLHSHPVPINDMDSWNIWTHTEQGLKEDDDSAGPYMPTWQTSPVLHGGRLVNENIIRESTAARLSFYSGEVVIGDFWMGDDETTRRRRQLEASQGDNILHGDTMVSDLLSASKQEPTVYQGTPISQVYFPIFDSFEPDRKTVAVMTAWIHWMDYFQHVLPLTEEGIQIVLKNTCRGGGDPTQQGETTTAYTFEIIGEDVRPIGKGDLHDDSFDNMVRTESYDSVENIADGTRYGLPLHKDHCTVTLDIYPSKLFKDNYMTSTPTILTVVVAVVFMVAVVLFLVYDRLVERRQRLVMRRAAQTSAIVSQLFPENVRDRLFEQAAPKGKGKRDSKHNSSIRRNSGGSSSFLAPNRRLKGFLNGGEEGGDFDDDDELDLDDSPIADLFPHCTVMFADISGFTAWSSTRDPAQVFILLQTLYEAFDKIANRRKVFKVETIGDSYVAVTGLPEPQENHATIMARFAGDCMLRMNQLVALLEARLGPDTAELAMRFGLHSGPVTAGVLRGERARFQLFGDTVNTAARMESTGVRNKIQVSQSTYDLLVEGGKSSWCKPRPDPVQAKGKGLLSAYFVDPHAKRGSSTGGSSVSGEESKGAELSLSTRQLEASPVTKALVQNPKDNTLSMKELRLVDWITDLLSEHVKKHVAMRNAMNRSATEVVEYEPPAEGLTPLDEVAEVILLPDFDGKAFAAAEDFRTVSIKPEVMDQLRDLVATIATMYNNNDFHNYEHACHVTMATSKLLKRIESPDIVPSSNDNEMASDIHAYTHGITSDPLTLLAIVFSALIHDVDHMGVSNLQLGNEQPHLRELYHEKSIAEQNSLDLSWDLLMSPKYAALRQCLFSTQEEQKRFRQVLVNVVLATDIFDKELNGLRRKRWEKAFNPENELSEEENKNLKATIVIEHIIQASDVSHTMQHWHIYRKWNKRLFFELSHAYKAGRMAKDPATFWYLGEIGFFDNYVIPLAKKLKECHVFGVSSDECLDYAIQNRNEWKQRGQQIVEEMVLELANE